MLYNTMNIFISIVIMWLTQLLLIVFLAMFCLVDIWKTSLSELFFYSVRMSL